MGQALDRLLASRGAVALSGSTPAVVHEVPPPSTESEPDADDAAQGSGQPAESEWESAADVLGANCEVFEKTPDLAAAFSDLQAAVGSRNLARTRDARWKLVFANDRRFISQAADDAVQRVSAGMRESVLSRGTSGRDMQAVVPLAGPPAFVKEKMKGGDKDADTEHKAVADMKAGDHFEHPDDKKTHQLVSKTGGGKKGGKPAPWMVRSKPADGKGAPKAKMMAHDAKLPTKKSGGAPPWAGKK